MQKNAKPFENCISRLLQFYINWIRDFSNEIQEYTRKILQITFKYMSSSYVSAKIKKLSAEILHATVEVKILPNDEIQNVLGRLLQSYDPRRTKVYCK